MIRGVEQEITPLINENDLHITQLAVKLLTLMLQSPAGRAGGWPAPGDATPATILPSVYTLIQSSLLQGWDRLFCIFKNPISV